jgi:hypothetical protein
VARTAVVAIDESGNDQLLAAIVMPDHLHVLVELGTRLSLSQLVAKTKAAITRRCSDVSWQLNFFDYQLRSRAQAEDFALYIFMNPYSATLCALDETWPGWIPSRHIRWSFEGKLRTGGLPQPQWLAVVESFARTLPEGAG